jgi:type IV secretion system protein VirB1
MPGIPDLLLLLATCAPSVNVGTSAALVQIESAGNPYAIAIVGAELERQPRNRAEAIATIRVLAADGWNFSVGLGQINQSNFARLGVTAEALLDACTNLKAMEVILTECFTRARAGGRDDQAAVRAALSCYYSGNFSTGFRHGYVSKVVNAATQSRRDSMRVQTRETAP